MLLFNEWRDGYFHWLFECLTRLEGLEVYEAQTGRKPAIIVGEDLTSWQRETLSLLGYDEDRLYRWSDNRARVKRLVVPTVRRDRIVSAEAAKWLRDTMQDALSGVHRREFPSRVYVSRQGATRRRVRNEDALVAALSELEFERFVPSNMDVADQVRLFAGADIVVSPHGAGLANIIHAEDLSVIELFKPGAVRSQYFKLANALGFDYQCLVCESAGLHMDVDVDRVRSLVADVTTTTKE